MTTETVVSKTAALSRDAATVKNGNRMFVPVTAVRPDPDQPRKAFDEAKLKELAESIKAHGVIYDLIVAAGPAAPGSANGDRYIILDGERRWRAAQLAGLKEVPVAVRAIDAKAKLVLQVITNQQREALTALEEAAAYAKEIESGRHTVESLYKSLGVSRGTLFSRLVLNRLHPPVRAALEAGKISVSVAGLVAMVPTRAMQEKLLKEITDEEVYKFPYSVRDVQKLIDDDYAKQLKSAPFDVKGRYPMACVDGKFVVTPSGEFGTCENCMHRSGNMKEHFPDIKNPNVCTDVACYEVKAAAAASVEMRQARERGAVVLPKEDSAKLFTTWQPDEPKYGSKYVALNQECYEDPKNRTYKELLGKDAPQPVLALNPENRLVHLMEKSAVREALKAKGVKLPDPSSGVNSSYAEEEKKRKAKIALMQKAADQALPLVRAKLKELPASTAWRLIAAKNCFTQAWLARAGIKNDGRGTRKAMDDYLEKLPEQDLRVGALEAEYCSDMVGSYRAEFCDDFLSICKVCKVDLEKLLAGVKAAAKKTAKPKKPGKGVKGRK